MTLSMLLHVTSNPSFVLKRGHPEEVKIYHAPRDQEDVSGIYHFYFKRFAHSDHDHKFLMPCHCLMLKLFFVFEEEVEYNLFKARGCTQSRCLETMWVRFNRITPKYLDLHYDFLVHSFNIMSLCIYIFYLKKIQDNLIFILDKWIYCESLN